MHSVIVMHRVLLKRDHCRPIDALHDDNGNDDDDDGDGDDDDSDDGEDNSDTHWLCITALSHIKSPKVARVCCQGSLVDNTINGDGDQPDDGDCGQNDDVVS